MIVGMVSVITSKVESVDEIQVSFNSSFTHLLNGKVRPQTFYSVFEKLAENLAQERKGNLLFQCMLKDFYLYSAVGLWLID